MFKLSFLVVAIAIAWVSVARSVITVPCGDSCVCILDNETGYLKVRGNGLMTKPCDVNSSEVKIVEIEDGIKSIAPNAFAGNGTQRYILTDLIIGNSVVDIGDRAFYQVGLPGPVPILQFPDSVVTIGNEAFDGASLGHVTIGKSVKTIGDRAFSSALLKQVSISKSVTHIGTAAFFGSMSLELFNVDPENQFFEADDGVLYTNGKTELIQYPGEKEDKSFDIPDTVQVVRYGAFYRALNLKSLTIPNSVKILQNYSFEYCENVDTIVIPDSVTSIGFGAFAGCTGLSSLTIGNSVTYIDAYAFNGCKNLVSIVIPHSVKFLGESAFGFCTKLTTVAYLGESDPDGAGEWWVFNNCFDLSLVCVPANYTSPEFCKIKKLSNLAKCGISPSNYH